MKNPQAFPTRGLRVTSGEHEISHADEPGMSLRDYFAAKILAAQISNTQVADGIARAAKDEGVGIAEALSVTAYEFADAMLAARGEQ